MSPESSHILFRHLLVFLAAIFMAGPAAAQSASRSTQNEANIRFASLRADEVNVRAGPGVRYHVKWVFVRKHLPVMITAEFESWRKIRDSEGAEGWVHRAMLSGRRSVVIAGEVTTLRRTPSETAPAVARLAPGIVAELDSCDAQWCRATAHSYSGWLPRKALWGLKDGETVE